MRMPARVDLNHHRQTIERETYKEGNYTLLHARATDNAVHADSANPVQGVLSLIA